MTTGDYQQVYNVAGAIGTFCLLPGVWDRLDVPDLTMMAAPKATHGRQRGAGSAFPAGRTAGSGAPDSRGVRVGGMPGKTRFLSPPKPHCYDADIQEEAFVWFERHLKRET